MKNRVKIFGFLFVFLIITPYQVFGHSPRDGLGGINSPWLAGQENPLEPGVNWWVLGTFAAINLGFILFGAIRKFNKNRKVSLN